MFQIVGIKTYFNAKDVYKPNTFKSIHQALYFCIIKQLNCNLQIALKQLIHERNGEDTLKTMK